MLHGVGDIWVSPTTAPAGIGERVIQPLELFSFSFAQDVTKLEAKAQKKGVLKTIASAQGEVTSTLTLSTQFGDWSHLEFFTNQFATPVTNVAIPVLKTGRVPATSPYEITDAAITSGNAAGVYAYMSDGADPGYLTVGTSTPSAGEFIASNGKITLHSSAAGRLITYMVPTTVSSTERLGGAIVDSYGTIELWGTVYGTNWRIHFPSLTFSTAPSLEFTGDVGTLQVEFSANTPVGSDQPYNIYR